MQIKSNFPLKSYNTFSIDVKTKYFVQPSSISDLNKLLSFPDFERMNKFIIGSGSNVLFTSDFDGIVINPAIMGISVIGRNSDFVVVRASAGEDWDSFVKWSISKGFGGLENLSLIPGTVGASPIQNIGAYGVEAGDLIERVEVFELKSGKIIEIPGSDCQFAYRNSIFKQEFRNKFIITAVIFKLWLKPDFKINYGAVKSELDKSDFISLETIRQAIINIRQSKLPDPKIIPNAGSFFKNPSVSQGLAELLKVNYPDLVFYKNMDGSMKIAAGWLIEHLGWKGKTINGAGVHEKQALVLVNKENASGKQILELASQIRKSVFETFGIDLEYEVNIV